MKSSRKNASGADNKSLEYLIFEFHTQIQQRQFFFIAAVAIFKLAANSGCQVLLQKIL
ncbi:hypothetical protein [Nostoc sp. WHI]|uniref:hypothetical protein n=1 Tax=Nostoc sp. WHI TaxID=2650611 RepID=UPI0018C4E7A9|nr:hypothetical protein [Nostoc sp. WHI]